MPQKRKQKAKSFGDQIRSMFGGTQRASAQVGKSSSQASLAERINFGGRGSELKKKRQRRSK